MMNQVMRRWTRLLAFAVLLPVLVVACEIEPEPVHVGSEECAHCSMLISERRYAAQLLTKKGKAFKFDSIECLRTFVQAGTVASADTHSVWVTDGETGDGWVAAGEATFLRSAELRTPMGGGLAAYASAADARRAAADLNGVVLSWSELLNAETEASAMGDDAAGGAAHGHGGHGAAH